MLIRFFLEKGLVFPGELMAGKRMKIKRCFFKDTEQTKYLWQTTCHIHPPPATAYKYSVCNEVVHFRSYNWYGITWFRVKVGNRNTHACRRLQGRDLTVRVITSTTYIIDGTLKFKTYPPFYEWHLVVMAGTFDFVECTWSLLLRSWLKQY